MDERRNRIELLVMGARPDSLGEAIVDYALQSGWDDNDVVSCGVTEHEDFPLNVLDHPAVSRFFLAHDVRNVICTVGINHPMSVASSDIASVLSQHFFTNVIGVANAMQCWKTSLTVPVDIPIGRPPHFAAVSSNSAQIARRMSSPYCTSKAALSMFIRVAAREWAMDNVCVYGWEPGMIEDTLMTREVFGHRIPSGEPVRKSNIAKIMVESLNLGIEINGCLFRVDGGEQ